MNLINKSRTEIERALRNKDRPELLDLIFELVTVEPHFSVSQLARFRKVSRGTILDKIRNGEIAPVHRPVKNALRIPLSAIAEWDANTKIRDRRFNPEGGAK
jgi:hypothetical protein